MRKISLEEVYNIFAVYHNNAPAEFYIKDLDESIHDFALQIFEKSKTENTKKFSIYPYGNPEYSEPVLEYYKHEDDIDFWVIPKDDLFEK